MGKVCSFFGHRKIEKIEQLVAKLDELLEMLIVEKGVTTFLFGSRSEFDSLCHQRVTLLQRKYPEIKRIMHTCRSEYACPKEEKEERERIARAVTKREIIYQDYDGEVQSERVYNAGRASYVERNQEMIDASDYCIFYYNPNYLPPRRKYGKRYLGDYQPKSGTALAFDYAKRRGYRCKGIMVINLWKQNNVL